MGAQFYAANPVNTGLSPKFGSLLGSVADGAQSLKRRWVNISCLMRTQTAVNTLFSSKQLYLFTLHSSNVYLKQKQY